MSNELKRHKQKNPMQKILKGQGRSSKLRQNKEWEDKEIDKTGTTTKENWKFTWYGHEKRRENYRFQGENVHDRIGGPRLKRTQQKIMWE